MPKSFVFESDQRFELKRRLSYQFPANFPVGGSTGSRRADDLPDKDTSFRKIKKDPFSPHLQFGSCCCVLFSLTAGLRVFFFFIVYSPSHEKNA
jgi:hypothetical protein